MRPSMLCVMAFSLVMVLVSAVHVGVLADDAVQLTTDPRTELDPAWSPDGALIAFALYEGSSPDIWVIPAAGGTATQLIDIPARESAEPCWSPDGSHLAFRTGSAIWVTPFGGSTWTEITSGGGYNGVPAWSPDGSQIAFSSLRSGNVDIWVIPATGGTATQVTTDPGVDYRPSWSPDGSQIVYSSDGGICAIPATGGTPVQITTGGDDPCWSPDGTQIAFDSNRDIWVVPATGGTPVRVTDDPAEDIRPCWSPDGSMITFVSNRAGHADIWVICAGGPSSAEESTWGRIKSLYK
ncbi:MAG: DPP IV N-terminal domain-containing protein [bacterium]|jgi:TolB protein